VSQVLGVSVLVPLAVLVLVLPQFVEPTTTLLRNLGTQMATAPTTGSSLSSASAVAVVVIDFSLLFFCKRKF
jgi:hypothetical protein